MKDIVDNNIRDSIMNIIMSKPGNQTCFDCHSPSPRWSSPYLGILLCIECAGRHRSYGTHISFVKSIDLDKWNKKQLKSLELTGNSYATKKFNELNIPVINSIYDYNNELIQKYKKDIEKLVIDNLKKDDYTTIDDSKKYFSSTKTEKEYNDNNENSLLNPVKFEIEKKMVKGGKNQNSKNKIKKIDIDFDFENFTNDTSNDNKENNDNQNINTNKIKGMKLSRKDKKLQMIEEKKNKNKNDKNNKSCCEKFREFFLNIFGLNKNSNKNDNKIDGKRNN